MRTELEVRSPFADKTKTHNIPKTRMVHITPSELLLPEEGLSKSTDKMLAYFTAYVSLKTACRKIPD